MASESSSLAVTGSKIAHQAEARRQVQLSWEVPINDDWAVHHINTLINMPHKRTTMFEKNSPE
jgi:hypothetical protein